MLVLSQVPISVHLVVTDRFLSEKYAEKNHAKAPNVHSGRVFLEFLEETLGRNEGRIEALVREDLVAVRFART